MAYPLFSTMYETGDVLWSSDQQYLMLQDSYQCYEWFQPLHRGYVSDYDLWSVEDWARRYEKRSCAVEAIKRRPEYTHCQRLPRAKTPDPSTLISKRAWERLIQQWRAALRGDTMKAHA